MLRCEQLFCLVGCFFLLVLRLRRFRRHLLHYLHATAAAKFLFLAHHRLHHAGKVSAFAAVVELLFVDFLSISHFNRSSLCLIWRFSGQVMWPLICL
jgi:hypothetical protein